MKIIFAAVFIMLSSCRGQNRESGLTGYHAPLSSELMSILLDYQRKYPIPVEDKNHDLYVYIVSFYKKASDTIVKLTRPAAGLYSTGWDVVLGVYQDSSLSPTFIRDDSTLYSKGFINKLIYDSASRELFKPHREIDYSEAFPPDYQYKVKNGNLVIDKIDTVWRTW